MISGDLIITIQDDGSVKIDATGAKGTAAEIKKELETLARTLGGTWTEEAHAPGVRHHHHERGHVHN